MIIVPPPIMLGPSYSAMMIPSGQVLPVGRTQMRLINQARRALERTVIVTGDGDVKAARRLAERGVLRRMEIRSLQTFKLTPLGETCWLVVLQ